jgi:chain length determinant protein (polysaccharide antigen chain regulator)
LAGPVVSSLDPVKPKKLLILLGAIFSSAFIGVFIALVSHAIKNYQARPENRF